MNRERGSLTIIGLIMILLLSSLSATLLILSTTALQIATNHRDGLSAQYWAETGMQSAVVKLKTDTEFVSQTVHEIHEDIVDVPSTLAVTGRYTVQTGPDTKTRDDNIRLVTATAMVNQAKRQITARITLSKPEKETTSLKIVYSDL